MMLKLLTYKTADRNTAGNKQFGVMAREQLRLNIFELLNIYSSIEVYQ